MDISYGFTRKINFPKHPSAKPPAPKNTCECGEPLGFRRSKFCDACAKKRNDIRKCKVIRYCECGNVLERYRKKYCFDCATKREAERMRKKAKVYYENNRIKILNMKAKQYKDGSLK